MSVKKYPEEPIQVPRFNEENGFYTTKERSKIMSGIRSKNTKPEINFRKALWASGVRFRKGKGKLPGNPDVAIKKYKLAVFIDGEFWHGHNWEEKKHKIKTNRDFWIPKIERNMQRDHQNDELLKQQGFTIFRFWETEVRKDVEGCVKKVVEYVNSKKP